MRLASRLALLLVPALAACGSTAAPAPSAAPSSPAVPVSAPASTAAKPAASAVASTSVAAGKTPVTISYGAATASQSSTWIAQDEGFYDKYGLKADVRFIASGPLSTTALIGGDVEFAISGGDAFVSARVKGQPVVEIGSFKNYLTGALMAKPGVDKLDQVKKISVSRIGSNTHYLARQALKRSGIDPNSVTFIQSGSGANDVAALASGQVDAAATVPPDDLAAQHQGAHLLLDMTALKIPYPAAAIITTQSVLQKKPDVARSVLKALGAAMHTYFTDEPRAEAIIAKWAKLEDKEAIQDAYNSEKKVLEEQLTPRPEAVAALLEDQAAAEPAAKDFKPEQVIDASLLNELVSSGFFKTL